MMTAVEPVFASGGSAWPLAGMPGEFEPDDPDLDMPHDAIRSGSGDLPEQHFPLPRDHRITHTATAPLAPAELQPVGRKWNLSFIASCMFHAAIAGFFLYAVDEAVLIEGADFSGVAYLGAGEDQLKAGETSEIDQDTVDVTMVTMLQAKPVETVEAEVVPVEDTVEAVTRAEAVTAEMETLQPVTEQPVQQVTGTKAQPVTTQKTEPIPVDAQRQVDAERNPAEPVETQPVRTVTETVPEVLATDRAELVDDDNVVQKPAEVQAAEAVEAAETTQIQPVETVTEVQGQTIEIATFKTSATAAEGVAATAESATPVDSQPAESVKSELTVASGAAVSETSSVESTEIAQAEQSETEVVGADPIVTPNVAPHPEPKPKQIAEAEPAKRKAAKQEQQKPKKAADGKKVVDKARARPNKSGNGGQNQANTRRGQADGQEKGDSKQASRGGSKKGTVGNAAASNYPGKVRSKLARIARSVRAKGKGEVIVAFAVGANGAVRSARVARSSGVATVDQAALHAVRKASPFPPIPKNAGRSSWEFSVPLAFLR